MKIGIVTAWSDGGAGYVSRAYRSVLERTHPVYVLARGTADARQDPYWNGPDVTWARPHSALTGVHGRQFALWVRENALDAVFFNEQRHWGAVVEARKLGLLVGAYVDYYTIPSVPLHWLYDFLITNTRRHYSVFDKHPQVFYVPWGTSIDMFVPKPRPSRPLTFLHSSGLSGPNDRKGTGITLRAFRAVRGNARLVIHSQLALNECPVDWQQSVRSDSRVEFIHRTEKPPGLYHLGDVYVYPCRLDGIGLSVVEALACGLPAIVPDAAPWNEFVDGSVGTLLPIVRQVARQDGYFWPEVEVAEHVIMETMQAYADNIDRTLAQGRCAREHAVSALDWVRNGNTVPSIIEHCRRLAPEEGPTAALENAARRHDRGANPSAWQEWVLASRRLLRSIRTWR